MSVEAVSLSPRAGAASVRDLPVGALSDPEVSAELRRLRRLGARVEARCADLVAEADRRGIPEGEGFGSTTAWLIGLTGDPPAVCRSRVRVALALRHMPVTFEAFSAGEVSEPRVRLLVDCRDAVPELFCRDEALLADHARSLSARVFPLAVSHWRRLADPDGARGQAERLFERRRLHVSSTWEGLVRLDGDLDPEGGTFLLRALESLSGLRPCGSDDARTAEQRRADALVEVCRRHLDSGESPTQGGEKPHLIITVGWDALQQDGLVDLEAGPITTEALRRLACDADLTRIIIDGDLQPLGAGRRTRIIPSALRRALALRDQGCTHPGCDIPARWCDAHHNRHWANGGRTDLANLRLLCRRHHRTAHHHNPYPRRE
ncbi:MAG: DUF222 domain-containing protein [Actinomycetota bacterium]